MCVCTTKFGLGYYTTFYRIIMFKQVLMSENKLDTF